MIKAGRILRQHFIAPVRGGDFKKSLDDDAVDNKRAYPESRAYARAVECAPSQIEFLTQKNVRRDTSSIPTPSSIWAGKFHNDDVERQCIEIKDLNSMVEAQQNPPQIEHG